VPRRTQAAFVALLQERHLQAVPSSFNTFQCRFLASKRFAPSLCDEKKARNLNGLSGGYQWHPRTAVQILHHLFPTASTSERASIHAPSQCFQRAMARWCNSSFPSVTVVVVSWLPSRGSVKCVKASLRSMYSVHHYLCAAGSCEDECPRCCCFDIFVSIRQTSSSLSNLVKAFSC